MTVSFGQKVVSHFYFKYIYIYIHTFWFGGGWCLLVVYFRKIELLLFSRCDFLFGYPDESRTNGGD